MAQFHLSSAQRKTNLWIGGLTTIGLLALAAVLSATVSDADTASTLLLVVLAVTLGIIVRTSAKRGWRYAAQERSSQIAFHWTGFRRLGVVWRAIGMLVAGRWLISLVGNLASGDISLAIIMALALGIIIAGAIVIGLFFGWKEASKQLDAAGPQLDNALGGG